MKIYLDMDGVIADFFGGLEDEYGVDHWKELPNPQEAVDNLKNTPFFGYLNDFPTSKALVDFVRELAGDNYGICSSPLRGDLLNSSYWKRVWLDGYGFEPETENLIFTNMKHKYATGFHDEPNILVDDKPKNIREWIKAGGIGILYQANKDSLEDLLAKLKSEYRE